jgi:Notch-like protein
LTGYTGTYCDQVINNCQPQPCYSNGTVYCTNNIGFYTCVCKPQYTGPQCQTQINFCSNAPCANGGTCTPLNMDLAGVGFSCKCTAQWSGPTCQIKVNQCLLNPCINGACFPSAFTPFYACTWSKLWHCCW